VATNARTPSGTLDLAMAARAHLDELLAARPIFFGQRRILVLVHSAKMFESPSKTMI